MQINQKHGGTYVGHQRYSYSNAGAGSTPGSNGGDATANSGSGGGGGGGSATGSPGTGGVGGSGQLTVAWIG